MNFKMIRDVYEISGAGEDNKTVDLVIPSENEGVAVKSIGYGAFKGCNAMKTLVIPGSIETIGTQAFYGCLELTRIEIQDGVKKIKEDAFAGCNRAVEIIIPASVESIEYGAFSGCDKNVEYTIKVVGLTEKPAGWDNSWNNTDKTVIWDFKG